MIERPKQNRRLFLKSATVTAAALSTLPVVSKNALGFAIAAGPKADAKAPTSPEEFKRRLEGPILSNPAPFKANFEVDYAAVRKIVQRALRYGVKIFALTAGNSQYSSMSYEEIKELTKVMVEAVDGQGLTIAATGDWWTQRAVDYAQFAESIGADAVQVLLPGRSGGEDSIVKHFETVARSTKLGIVLHGVYPQSLFEKLMKIDTIVAMKEDGALSEYVERQVTFGNRINIFGGGQEYRYIVGYPYGAKAFYSTYSTFAPDISMMFWKAIQANDLKSAVQITTKYDYPYLASFTHPWWHATLEYFGVGERYLRPPQLSYTDEQMKQVKAFFDKQGIDPAKYRS